MNEAKSAYGVNDESFNGAHVVEAGTSRIYHDCIDAVGCVHWQLDLVPHHIEQTAQMSGGDANA